MTSPYFTASQLLDTLRAQDPALPTTVPVDVDAIAALLGIRIVYTPCLESNVVGVIEFDAEQRATITVNTGENGHEPTRRFTVAHLIAHACLHAGPMVSYVDTRKTMSRTRSYWNEVESAANIFAAQLLMPKPLVIAEAERLLGKVGRMDEADFVSEMAQRFKVSGQAMRFRLQAIGILNRVASD